MTLRCLGDRDVDAHADAEPCPLRASPVRVPRRVALGLALLGYASEADLARALRDGTSGDDELAGVAAFVAATVEAKLTVANPAYLDEPQAPQAPQAPTA